MAAEKLTPGRFAQIIIMLTLLVAAFTWRTLDYDKQDQLECNLTQSVRLILMIVL